MKPPFHPDYEVRVRPLNDINAIGATYYDLETGKRIIYLDPFQPTEEREDTAVHEFFHAVYPEMDEREIEGWTTATLEWMTAEEKQDYLNFYYQSVWRKIGNIVLWIRSLENL